MKFNARFKADNFKYFIDCLNCLNKLSRDISKSSVNVLRITPEKVDITTKTNGILDSYYEIHTSELFVDPVVLDEEGLTIEVNINSLYESLNSAVRSEEILVSISDTDTEYLHLKYVDSIYSTINITLKIPILIVPNEYNKPPDIPLTNYNVNLSRLQTISFLLTSLGRIGNNVVELNIHKHPAPRDSVINKCSLKFKSIGSIANIESLFTNLQLFSSHPDVQRELVTPGSSSEGDSENINIHLNINILNTLFRSIIESNLYSQNKSLVIISIPDDPNNSQYIYVAVSIIQLETSQMTFIVPNIKD